MRSDGSEPSQRLSVLTEDLARRFEKLAFPTPVTTFVCVPC